MRIIYHKGTIPYDVFNESEVWLDVDGKYHRISGPAYHNKSKGVNHYYIEGKWFDEESYWNHPMVKIKTLFTITIFRFELKITYMTNNTILMKNFRNL